MELLCVLALMAISAAFIYGSKNSATAKAQPFIIGILGTALGLYINFDSMPRARVQYHRELDDAIRTNPLAAIVLWFTVRREEPRIRAQ